MLWYKSWLETRWRFLIGLALLMCSAAGMVLAYPKVMQLMPLVPDIDIGGEIGRRIRESAELAREYRGYVWAQWFRQSLMQMGILFAVLLGTGGLLGGRGTLFTLSLPVTRDRLLGIRAATGLAELFALVFVPSLLIPLVSPAVGERYGVATVLIHSVCLYVGASLFFSLTMLLATMFSDLWRPLLIALLLAVVLGLAEQIFRDSVLARYGIFRVMNGESYFRNGELPWQGLIAAAVASAAMLYGAAVNIAHRDF